MFLKVLKKIHQLLSSFHNIFPLQPSAKDDILTTIMRQGFFITHWVHRGNSIKLLRRGVQLLQKILVSIKTDVFISSFNYPTNLSKNMYPKPEKNDSSNSYSILSPLLHCAKISATWNLSLPNQIKSERACNCLIRYPFKIQNPMKVLHYSSFPCLLSFLPLNFLFHC